MKEIDYQPLASHEKLWTIESNPMETITNIPKPIYKSRAIKISAWRERHQKIVGESKKILSEKKILTVNQLLDELKKIEYLNVKEMCSSSLSRILHEGSVPNKRFKVNSVRNTYFADSMERFK